MSTVINGSSPSITFSDGTTQSTAANITAPYTANGVVYASSTSALATGSGLVFDGSNLGLGITPSAWSSSWSGKILQLGYGTVAGYSDARLEFFNNCYVNTSGNVIYSTSNGATVYAMGASSGVHAWYNAPSGTAGNTVTLTQAMTLDNSGNLRLGLTGSIITPTERMSIQSASGSVGLSINAYGSGAYGIGIYGSQASGATNQTMILFQNSSSATVGSIVSNGTATAYNISSDQRLKTDLGQVTSTNVIDNTIIHDFVWKSDGSQSRGVFAQEAYKVIPSAVKVGDDGEEVEDVWAVDYSKYVPDLIVYCQQLNAEIQSLKAEVSALKGA